MVAPGRRDASIRMVRPGTTIELIIRIAHAILSIASGATRVAALQSAPADGM